VDAAYTVKVFDAVPIAASGTVTSARIQVSRDRKANLFTSATGAVDAKLQASPDAGASWFDLPGVASGAQAFLHAVSLEGITDVRVSATDTSLAANAITAWLGFE
jgi:hypothetical protein